MNKLKVFVFLILALSSFAFELKAQDTLSLDQLIELSMQQNFDIKMSKLGEKSASTQNTIGMAGFLPRVYLSVGDRWNVTSRNNPTSFINGKIMSSNLTPSVTVDQMLFNGFAAQITKDNFDQLEALSKENSSLILINNLKALYLSYYQIQAQNSLLDNQIEILALSQKLYEYNNQKWELGLITTQELNTYYGFVLEDSLSILSIKSQITKMEGELAKLCNVQNLKVRTEKLPALNSSWNSDSLFTALLQNPSLRSVYINQQLKENELRMSKSSLYPQVVGSAGYNYSRSNFLISGRDPVVGTSKDFYVGFSINYNLFNGFKTQTNINLSQINLETQSLKTEQLEQKLKIDLSVYLSNYDEFYSQLELSDKLLGITQNTLDYWQAKQKAGLITSIELRNYQKNYLLNRNTQVNQWLKTFQTSLEIQSLTNQLIY